MTTAIDPSRIRAAWEGRISGCMLGKPLEVLSFQEGLDGIAEYLDAAGARPLRGYVPLVEGTTVERTGRACCAGQLVRAEPDDDINYTVLALLMLEETGMALETADVARAWLRLLPGGTTWTAERAAYRTLLDRMDPEFVNDAGPGFDLAECSDNEYNDWIGAQIRADLYGWVCPGARRSRRTWRPATHRSRIAATVCTVRRSSPPSVPPSRPQAGSTRQSTWHSVRSHPEPAPPTPWSSGSP